MLIIDVEDDFNDSDFQNDSGSNPERHTELMIRIKTCISYEFHNMKRPSNIGESEQDECN